MNSLNRNLPLPDNNQKTPSFEIQEPSTENVLFINILKKEHYTTINTDRNSSFKVMAYNVESPSLSRKIYLWDFTAVSTSADKPQDLKIFITGKKVKEINPFVVGNIKNKLLDLFNNASRPCERFDCVKFINYLFETNVSIPNHPFLAAEFNETNLKPGVCIVISSSYSKISNEAKMNVVHMALYLGKKLYIQIGGIDGPLMITNLEEMKKAYEGDLWILIHNSLL